MNHLLQILLVSSFMLIGMSAFAQTDSLVFHNGDQILGEIKTMDKGVLVIETAYSDVDFKIKWIDIKEVYSNTRFLISLRDGERMIGKVTTKDSNEIVILTDEGIEIFSNLEEIVYLKGLESDFWNRVHANIDFGINATKANNFKQFSIQAALGYLADTWSSDAYYSDLFSSQDSIESTRRIEAGINFKQFLEHDWYLTPEVTYLSNTEQALKGRITAKFGVGRFFIHTNKSYWGWVGGLSLLSETFTNNTESRNSAEVYAGTETNLFDAGDLSLLSSLYIYPSLTEKGRIRSDYKLDTKYEFVQDFYVKFNLTLNYDNRPAVEGKKIDYVYGISFGWEL